MTMTKHELAVKVARHLGVPQSEVAKIVKETLDTIARSLAEGERWEFRDFGVFEAKTHAARVGRNPRTGESVPVPARRVVTFRPGKKLKELLADPETPQKANHSELPNKPPSENTRPTPEP